MDAIGSIDLLSLFAQGVDMWSIFPTGETGNPKGASVDEEHDAVLDTAFRALTVGLSEDQVNTLRDIMLAHVTFLIGALQMADGPVTEGQ